MHLTITQASNYDSTKSGSPLIDKKGKPYFRSVIKTVEKGNEFLSGFVYQPLQVGHEIEAKVTSETYQGKVQLKFQIEPNGERMAQGAAHQSEVHSELKAQTSLLHLILEELEKFNRNAGLEKDISAILGKKADRAPDYSDEDALPTDHSDEFPISEEDLPDFSK